LRIKMLRTLGNNLPDVTAEDGEVDLAALRKGPPPAVEGAVLDAADAVGKFLVKHGLAEAQEDPAKAAGHAGPGRSHGPTRER